MTETEFTVAFYGDAGPLHDLGKAVEDDPSIRCTGCGAKLAEFLVGKAGFTCRRCKLHAEYERP